MGGLHHMNADLKKNVPNLTKRLISDFGIFTETHEIEPLRPVMSLLPTTSFYRLKMKTNEETCGFGDNDEINLTRAILRQAERISEQSAILKQIDRDIISNQTIGLHHNDIIQVEE